MSDERSANRDLKQSLTSDATHVFTIGSYVYIKALSANGKPFVFSRKQMEFFLALQQLKQVHAAALAVNESEEWANRFLSSKKFKLFIAAKMQEMSIRNGVTVDWWYQFGMNLASGQRFFYGGFCEPCKKDVEFTEYEAELCRGDDMVIKAECADCQTPVALERRSEIFKPTREQVEGWKELGSRLIPKIERVQHEYDKTQIEFQTTEASQ